MSKDNSRSGKPNKINLICLIAVLLVALMALLCLAWFLGGFRGGQSASGNDETVAVSAIQGTGETAASRTDEDSEDSQNGKRETENPDTLQSGASESAEATEAPVVEMVTQPPVEILEQADADYERWLAASMLLGISLESPDFEITGIYLASETTLDDKMNSKGCYILFNSFGEQKAIYSSPLEGERSAAGTKDISSQNLGFATFDAVDPASVDTASMIEVTMDDLSELIAQSLLVSVYSH